MDRIKPWVGWMQIVVRNGKFDVARISSQEDSVYCMPVCVTAYEPDDPKVGEVWLYADGTRYEITGAPFVFGADEGMKVPCKKFGWELGTWKFLEHLTRIPEAKTYRLRTKDLADVRYCGFGPDLTFTAESKEAAAAQIVESLVEEVS